MNKEVLLCIDGPLAWQFVPEAAVLPEYQIPKRTPIKVKPFDDEVGYCDDRYYTVVYKHLWVNDGSVAVLVRSCEYDNDYCLDAAYREYIIKIVLQNRGRNGYKG